jgi:hypothetical protein
MPLEMGNETGDGVRAQKVVGVEKQQVLGLVTRLAGPDISGSADTTVGQADQASREVPERLANNLGRPVSTTVVHDDQLDVLIALRHQAPQGVSDE